MNEILICAIQLFTGLKTGSPTGNIISCFLVYLCNIHPLKGMNGAPPLLMLVWMLNLWPNLCWSWVIMRFSLWVFCRSNHWGILRLDAGWHCGLCFSLTRAHSCRVCQLMIQCETATELCEVTARSAAVMSKTTSTWYLQNVKRRLPSGGLSAWTLHGLLGNFHSA